MIPPILTGPGDALIHALALAITLTLTVAVVLGVRLYRRSQAPAKRRVKRTILLRKT